MDVHHVKSIFMFLPILAATAQEKPNQAHFLCLFFLPVHVRTVATLQYVEMNTKLIHGSVPRLIPRQYTLKNSKAW